MNRRDLLNVGGMIATSTMLTSYRVSAAQTAAPNPYEPAFALLDRFVEEYLADMNAPGLTLALADASGVQRVCTYGLDDLARHTPLNVTNCSTSAPSVNPSSPYAFSSCAMKASSTCRPCRRREP
jgi:hypothetical protein